MEDDPVEGPVERIDKTDSVDDQDDVGGEQAYSAENIVIRVDKDAFEAGFEAPFDVTIKAIKDVRKGDLLKAVVAAWGQIPNGKADQIGKAFKRWCQKTFNMSDAAFSSPESLKAELLPAETTLVGLQSNSSSFEVLEEEAPAMEDLGD